MRASAVAHRRIRFAIALVALLTSASTAAAEHAFPGYQVPLDQKDPDEPRGRESAPAETEPAQPQSEGEMTAPLFDHRPNTEDEKRPGRRSLEELATAGFEPGPLERRLQSYLPLFKNLAGKFVDRLPLPMGFHGVFVTQWNKQRFISNEITFRDKTFNIPSSNFSLLENQSTSFVGVLDAWILPFLNIYGVGGYTTGELEFDVTLPEFGNLSLNVDRKLHGYTVGGGGVIGGAYNQMFLLVNLTYVTSNLNIFTENVETFVVAPRIGFERILGPMKGTFTIGANWYQQSTLRQSTFNFNGEDILINFRVAERNPWNAAVGVRAVFFHRLDVGISGGFGTRRSVMARVGMRF